MFMFVPDWSQNHHSWQRFSKRREIGSSRRSNAWWKWTSSCLCDRHRFSSHKESLRKSKTFRDEKFVFFIRLNVWLWELRSLPASPALLMQSSRYCCDSAMRWAQLFQTCHHSGCLPCRCMTFHCIPLAGQDISDWLLCVLFITRSLLLRAVMLALAYVLHNTSHSIRKVKKFCAVSNWFRNFRDILCVVSMAQILFLFRKQLLG